MALRDKFLAVRDDLRGCLLERESSIDNALLALLTGEHMLLLGPPGTGKSLLVRAVHARLEHTQWFERLMTSFTTPDEVFGPVDLMGMADHGTYKRLGAGTLSTAHVAFLDEVPRANSAILNSLLTIMNERLLHEPGMAPTRVPLLSLFGAANTTFAEGEGLQALNDRFLLREVVDYVHGEDAFVALMTAPLDITAVQASVTLKDITQAQQALASVTGTPEVLQALMTLRQQLSGEGVLVSDRKWRQCGKLLKARAWLDGLTALDLDCLLCLIHALWSEPREQKVVERLVYQIAAPLALRALEVQDMAEELYKTLPTTAGDWPYEAHRQAENVLQSLSDQHTLLQDEIAHSHSRNLDKAQAVLARLETLHQGLAQRLFQTVSRLSLSKRPSAGQRGLPAQRSTPTRPTDRTRPATLQELIDGTHPRA